MHTDVQRWMSASSQHIGRGHILKDLPCQDVTICHRSNRINIVVLADGAGSAKHSDIGAQICAQTVVDFFGNPKRRRFSLSNLKRRLLNKILNNLQKVADKQQHPLKDYASTLAFVVTNDTELICGNLGDGFTILLNDTRSTILPRFEGEFANETIFTTSSKALEHFYVEQFREHHFTGCCLLSDGAGSSLIREPDSQVSPAVHKMLRWLDTNTHEAVSMQLEKTLKQLLVPKTMDDCAIAMMKLVKHPLSYLESNIPYAQGFLQTRLNIRYSEKNTRTRLQQIRCILESPEPVQALMKLGHSKKYAKEILKNLIPLCDLSVSK